MLFEQFHGKNYAGYGCVVGNTKKDPKDTVAFQELMQNFSLSEDDIYIDMVMVNVKKRPVLNDLLDKMGQYDRIFVADISDLLGTTNKAREYYQKALEKGIEFCITDLTKTLFHIHPLSTMIPISSKPIKLDAELMLQEFDKFLETYKQPTKAGRRKCYINQFTHSWKQLYFAYESYQIDLETTLDRAKQFGINNYPTFVNMVADYERSIQYYDDTLEYAKKDPEFINFPKRIIKRAKGSYVLPSEYLMIKERAKQESIDININIENFQNEGFVSQTGENLNFLINNVIYKRYQNLETMKIPRKLRKGVNIEFPYV